MKPLILTISGYLLIITFIIFALLLSISLDASLWYDWIFTELEKEEYEVVCAKN